MTNLTVAAQEDNHQAFGKWMPKLLTLLLWFVGGLALSRLLYERFFPYLLWLGRPLYIILFALIITLLGTRIWQKQKLPAVALLPLLLNLLYLCAPAVDLLTSRFIFFASCWLAALLVAQHKADRTAWRWLGILFVLTALLPIYLLMMPDAVGQADTFEFQVVAPQSGIAHPTGYPLYLLLGKLFTLLPIKSVAWRLNAATMIYGLAATSLLFVLGYRMKMRGITAVLGATIFGLIPTFWSQAIEAEVYTLHTLFIVAAFLLMREMGQWSAASGQWPVNSDQGAVNRGQWLPILLAFVLGLGMTNHLTTVFLLPAAALTILFVGYFRKDQSLIVNLKSLIFLVLAFLLPLLLYAYLPLRWQALHAEPMGVARFVDWVLGGRFAGALQWRAWLDDMTRYEVIGRIYLTNWGWFNLGIALLGFIFMLWRNWRLALIFGITWLGYTFYGLNYYVPDLDVFIVGAQVVVAVWWMAGADRLLKIEDLVLSLSKDQRLKPRFAPQLHSLIFNFLIIAFMLPTLLNTPQTYLRLDQSQDEGGQPWGEGVLALPLAEGAAILADSEKIAPLYYLQQAEGLRPDLEIMVLPDEAAYRAELDNRIATGQPVYLARFLPGLEGIYHLRSLGPLTEVSTDPMTTLPETATSVTSTSSVTEATVSDATQLIGYEIDPVSPYDDTQTAVTLYWQATEPITQPLHVYLRLGEETTSGQHPANNSYPSNAWKGDEIVADFHHLPRLIPSSTAVAELEVAIAPIFTPADQLRWHPVTSFWAQESKLPPSERAAPLRQQIGSTLLGSVDFPSHIRPKTELPVTISGWDSDDNRVNIQLRPAGKTWENLAPIRATGLFQKRSSFTLTESLASNQAEGVYEIIAFATPDCSMGGGACLIPASYCGWFSFRKEGCVLGEVAISGVALPETAVNYNDQIALLNLDIPSQQLTPGGTFDLTLHWTALAPLNEDYTLFLQVLDANDRLVGQVDAWPLQGTLPTSQWQPGQPISDPYTIQLDSDLPPGDYRLLVGWYLLANLRRLPTLNENEAAVDDKLIVPGLFVAD